MRINLNLIGLRMDLLFRISKSKKHEVTGYTNRCIDGKYIVFLDYDDTPIDWILTELKALQELFHLGSFYLFESSDKSYHAVCFDKVVLSEYVQILRNSSVDPNYVNVPLKMGKRIWTLRLTDKKGKDIRLNMIMPNASVREQSSAHIQLIRNLFKDIIISSDRGDDETGLILAHYNI